MLETEAGMTLCSMVVCVPSVNARSVVANHVLLLQVPLSVNPKSQHVAVQCTRDMRQHMETLHSALPLLFQRASAWNLGLRVHNLTKALRFKVVPTAFSFCHCDVQCATTSVLVSTFLPRQQAR